MIYFNGPGSGKIRRELLAERTPPSILLRAPYIGAAVGIVTTYKHLGAKMHMNQSMAHEIAYRLSCARQTYGAISWPFLHAPRVDTALKLNIVKATLLSRGFFHAGCWPLLNAAEATRVHRGILAMYASCVPSATRHDGDLTYDEILAKYKLPAPAVSILSCRVRLFLRLLARAPRQLLCQLLAARAGKRSWIKAIISDFSHLACKTGSLNVLGSAPTFRQIYELSLQSPAAVRRALREYTADLANSMLDGWAPKPVRRKLQPFNCEFCGLRFGSRQAASVHKFRAHSVTPAIRRKVATPECPCCLQFFWSRSRLLEHFHKGKRCREYACSLEDLPAQTIEQADRAEADAARKLASQGLRRHNVAVPAIRAQGPHTLAAVECGVDHSNLLRSGIAAPP